VTRPIQNNQNVTNAKKTRKVANHILKPVTNAHQRKNFSNAMRRLLRVRSLKTKVISKRPVTPSADTSPHKNSSVPGEASWPRKE